MQIINKMGQNIKNFKILKLMGILAGVFLIATAIAAVNAGSNTNNAGVIEINISPIKDVYYAGDEITINFTLTPNKNGCFVTLIFTKINGSIETLFQHETGCKSCGLAKPPLTSKTAKQIKKKFDEAGIYEIQGMITDAGTYQMDYKTIKIIVKDVKAQRAEIEKSKDEKETESENIDENNTRIPIVIEVFTRDGCPICEHVDEAAKKLANEYNEKNKNSIILLEYHLQDTLATQAGPDRRIFYGGDEWQNACNFYALTLLNGEDEDCGGTHNTESDYRNLKNKVENKIIVSSVNMRANASYNKNLLYIDVGVKGVNNEAKNLDIFVFILDGTNVKLYMQKSAKTGKKQTANVKFSFPYGEISAYKNLKMVVLVHEGKKILNARLIEWKDVQEIKDVQNISTNTNKKNTNNTNIPNNTNVANAANATEEGNIRGVGITASPRSSSKAGFEITNSINFMYCAANRDMLYCAIKLTSLVFGDFQDNHENSKNNGRN